MGLNKNTYINTNFVDAGKKRHIKIIFVGMYITNDTWTILVDASRTVLCQWFNSFAVIAAEAVSSDSRRLLFMVLHVSREAPWSWRLVVFTMLHVASETCSPPSSTLTVCRSVLWPSPVGRGKEQPSFAALPFGQTRMWSFRPCTRGRVPCSATMLMCVVHLQTFAVALGWCGGRPTTSPQGALVYCGY